MISFEADCVCFSLHSFVCADNVRGRRLGCTAPDGTVVCVCRVIVAKLCPSLASPLPCSPVPPPPPLPAAQHHTQTRQHSTQQQQQADGVHQRSGHAGSGRRGGGGGRAAADARTNTGSHHTKHKHTQQIRTGQTPRAVSITQPRSVSLTDRPLVTCLRPALRSCVCSATLECSAQSQSGQSTRPRDPAGRRRKRASDRSRLTAAPVSPHIAGAGGTAWQSNRELLALVSRWAAVCVDR